MHVTHFPRLGETQQGVRVEAGGAHLLEGGRQFCQGLGGGAGTHVFIPLQQRHADFIDYGYHRGVEKSAVPGPGRPLLAGRRVGIDVLAGVAVQGRNQVGRYALGHEIVGVGQRGIGRPRAARGADRHA